MASQEKSVKVDFMASFSKRHTLSVLFLGIDIKNKIRKQEEASHIYVQRDAPRFVIVSSWWTN